MSGLTLERLLFDPTDFADGPTMGSYLISAGGTVITDTGGALDVNIATSDIDIQVDIDTSNFVADDEPDTENPLKVGTRAHNMNNALTAVSAAGDKADCISDLYRRLVIFDAPNRAVENSVLTVGLTAVALPKLLGRTRLMIQNNGDKAIFIGKSSVSTTNGLEVSKGGTLSLEAGQGLSVYAISGTAGQDVRLLELA